jgi:alpha/beta superfamily hydrolase
MTHFRLFSRLALAGLFAFSLVTTPQAAEAGKPTLNDARHGFTTTLVRADERGEAVPVPPKGVFNLVRFPSGAGKLAAYVSPDPADGKKHPAIVWITGGDSNSIGEMWSPQPRANDQSAAAYRKAGVITMFPTLRGGNDNPGRREGFYGEVDDILAAGKYLASLPYVDPNRVYLGGHSTGGTLAMLVAESSNQFRATFAFGPVGNPNNYGESVIFHDPRNARETALRSPIGWLDAVRTPLFLLEGGVQGNIADLAEFQKTSRNPMIHIVPVMSKTHFSILAPANELIAQRIIKDTAADKLLVPADGQVIGSH